MPTGERLHAFPVSSGVMSALTTFVQHWRFCQCNQARKGKNTFRLEKKK